MIIPFLPDKQLAACNNFLKCQGNIATAAVDLPSLSLQMDKISARYLATTELEKFNSFKYPKRRVEWLGGRIAAKEAISKMLKRQPHWHDMPIVPNSVGRPYISCGQQPAPDVSISHSGDLAVSLASKHQPCGIDIQNFTPTIIKIQERFALTDESVLIIKHTSLSQKKALTLLWTAKEALRKSFAYKKLLGFMEIQLSSITGSLTTGFGAEFNIWRQPPHIPQQVFLTSQPGYACSITVRNQD